MSTYAPGIAILLLALSPLFIPIAVTAVHGVKTWRANHAVTAEDSQRGSERHNPRVSSMRPRLGAARGHTSSAEAATPETAAA
jgi:hypothetical protein